MQEHCHFSILALGSSCFLVVISRVSCWLLLVMIFLVAIGIVSLYLLEFVLQERVIRVRMTRKTQSAVRNCAKRGMSIARAVILYASKEAIYNHNAHFMVHEWPRRSRPVPSVHTYGSDVPLNPFCYQHFPPRSQLYAFD